MKWGCSPRTQVVVPSSLHPPADLAEAITCDECGQGSPTPEGARSAYRLTRFTECGPKITTSSSGQADVYTPRQSEDRGGGQRHTEVDGPSSHAPIRSVAGGELPTNRPKPIRFPSAHQQLVSPDKRSASPGHRVAPPHRPVRTEVRTFQCLGTVAPPHRPARTEVRTFRWCGAGCPHTDHFPKEMAVGWTLERPGSSSRVSTPASFRLRRFSRPWRFAPLRALRRVSVGHARGVFTGEAVPDGGPP